MFPALAPAVQLPRRTDYLQRRILSARTATTSAIADSTTVCREQDYLRPINLCSYSERDSAFSAARSRTLAISAAGRVG